MDLSDAPDEAQFRHSLGTWLEKSLPELPWPEHPKTTEPAAFRGAQYDRGLAWVHFPEGFGGLNLPPIVQRHIDRRLREAGARAPHGTLFFGLSLAGPTVVTHGSDDLRRRALRPMFTGEEIWCQLFSEPDSGSDLASLRTKATKVEGGWRIQGQKIWTSRAQLAAHAILLARTGGGPRHKGITYFLLPMDSEGVTVRPLLHMLGEAEFNEVFLDDVFLPDDAVVGEVDGGWAVAMGTLAFERVAIATGRVNTTKAVDDLVAEIRLMTDDAGRPLGADPHVRQRVADLWARALVHHTISQRVISGAVAAGPPGPVTSIGKLYFCPLVEDLADFRLSLEPLAGQFGLDDTSQEAASARRWLRLANQARGTAIAGGSTFIQRNIVAERVLGMPR